MKNEDELNLFIDIMKILKKYDFKTLQSLSKIITSPSFNQNLLKILNEASDKGKFISTKKKRVASGRDFLPRELTKIKNKNNEKYQILLDFYKELKLKKLLPSLRDIKEFNRQVGLPEIKADSRQRAVNSLINLMVTLSNEQILSYIQKFRKDKQTDRSLEGWSNIILNKKEDKSID